MEPRKSSGSKRFIVGVWLTFLYISCVSLVVFSLSAYLFQVKVNSLPKKEFHTNSQFNLYYCDTAQAISDPENALSLTPCLPAPLSSKFYNSAEILRKYNNWKILNQEAENINIRLAQSKQQQLILQKSIKSLSSLGQGTNSKKLNATPLTIDQLELQKELIRGNIKNSQIKLTGINQLTNAEEENQLADIYTEIEGFQTFFKLFNFIFKYDYYWAVPKPILKIVLILSMGVLGSLIFVTIEFIKEPTCKTHQRCAMYFFRPFLGMILALAMYVMIKSGQSIIIKSNEQDLSPFFISFLGIVSGMLAERTYRRLALTGSKMLGEGEKSSRSPGEDKGE